MFQHQAFFCLLFHISYAQLLTTTVTQNDVTFRLFNRQNPTIYIPLVTGELASVSLDGTKPVKFIIHGYTDSANSDWVSDMKTAYLQKGDFNVIAVDWSGHAAGLYNTAAASTKDVGKFIGDLIIDLHNTFGVPYGNVHMTGHSLGAHVSGFAGQYILRAASALIGRITGLDVAGPMFCGNAQEDRLSARDAHYVDVIHTDSFKAGCFIPIGNIDFYANGGIAPQPGCLTRKRRDLGQTVACSHSRSALYYTESINSIGFVAHQCADLVSYIAGSCNNNPTAVMGFNVDISQKGIYFLKTKGSSPYANN